MMTAKAREIVFQLCGGGVALIIAVAGIYAGQVLLGEIGKFALILSVPLGVVTGAATVKLLRFAHRVLVDDELR